MASQFTWLGDSLRTFWREVQEMEQPAAQAFQAAFRDTCVREGFRRKFDQELNRRPITERFFDRPVLLDSRATVESVGSFGSGTLSGTIVWGGFDQPAGFIVHGRGTTFDRLFVDDGDAIASITNGKEKYWLFLSGARGTLFKL